MDQPPDMIETLPTTNGAMSASEVLHLVTLFDKSLERMESRLVLKMDENSNGAKERWAKHDRDADQTMKDIVGRFEKLETSLLKVEQVLEVHLDREHEEDVANQARVRPIKMSVAWIWAQRKDVLLFIIFLLATFAAAGEWISRIIGLPPHAP